MKLKSGFVLKEVAGECVVVNVNPHANLDGMITLNSTAKTLWLALEKGASEEELVRALTEEYEVDEETAVLAVRGFAEKLSALELLD